MTTLFLDFCNALAPSALLVLVAWTTMRFLRWNAATRYAAWWAVVAVLLVLPFVPKLVDRPASADSEPILYISPVEAAPVTSRVSAEPVAQQTNEPAWNPLRLFIALYAAVSTVLLVRLLVDYLRIRRMVRNATPSDIDCSKLAAWLGIHRKTRVLTSSSIETPLAAGFWRPAILLPVSLGGKLSENDLQHVFVHELAHIARFDDWTNLLGRLLRVFFWPHPFVAFAIHCIDSEREHACDDWVVNAAGGAAKSYAQSLTRLVELTIDHRQTRTLLAATVIGQGPRVSRRVELLLDRTRNFAPRISIVKLGMSVVCLVVFSLVCTQAPALVAMARPGASDELTELYAPGEPQAPTAPKSSPAPRAPQAPPNAPSPSATPAPASPATDPAALNSKPGFLAALAAAGYRDLSVDEIIELKNHGVTADYIREMSENGWGKLSAKQLVNLRTHGVSGRYLRELKNAGIRGMTLEQAVELRNHGVRPETITEIHSLGFGPYDLHEVTEMARNGLRPDFFRGLKERGITKMSAQEAVEAARHGLTPRSIDEARKYGPNLSFEQILKLKRAGVI